MTLEVDWAQGGSTGWESHEVAVTGCWLAVHLRGVFAPRSGAGACRVIQLGAGTAGLPGQLSFCVISPHGLSAWQPQGDGPLLWWLKAPDVGVPRQTGRT